MFSCVYTKDKKKKRNKKWIEGFIKKEDDQVVLYNEEKKKLYKFRGELSEEIECLYYSIFVVDFNNNKNINANICEPQKFKENFNSKGGQNATNNYLTENNTTTSKNTENAPAKRIRENIKRKERTNDEILKLLVGNNDEINRK